MRLSEAALKGWGKNSPKCPNLRAGNTKNWPYAEKHKANSITHLNSGYTPPKAL